MAYKVNYKQACTPMEKVNFGDPSAGNFRWYTDSDCKRRLGGSNEITLSSIDASSNLLQIPSTPTRLGDGGQNFIMVKSILGKVWLSLNGSSGRYYIVLDTDEMFASKVKSDVDCYAKADTGLVTNIKYLVGTI